MRARHASSPPRPAQLRSRRRRRHHHVHHLSSAPHQTNGGPRTGRSADDRGAMDGSHVSRQFDRPRRVCPRSAARPWSCGSSIPSSTAARVSGSFVRGKKQVGVAVVLIQRAVAHQAHFMRRQRGVLPGSPGGRRCPIKQTVCANCGANTSR